MRFSPILTLAATFCALTGCASYYLPASQLDTPEAIGPDRIGRLELVGIASGTDLVSTPEAGSPDAKTGKVPDPSLGSAPVNYAFGAWLGLNPKLDVGVRFSPFAPPVGRVKYQLYGEPESVAKAGNFSASLSGTGGVLLASGVSFYTATGALLGGWRFADHHIASLVPFFNLMGLSGAGAPSGSGTRFGASLGYQYDIESLLLRAELTWASGSVTQATGPATMGGIFPGAMLGFKL